MIGADILAGHLAAAGARRAFGIPGGEVLALIDALDRAGVGFHLARHETAAGFMAEGGWHADGGLPVLVATLGPGVANAVDVVANAMQDRVPLLVLTGCVAPAEAESYTHQIFDHRALLAPIVKASFRAAPGTVGLVAEKAVALARDGQPGPVHIDLPVAVAEAETAETPAPRLAPPGATAAFVPDEASLAAAAEVLGAARRPLAIAGVDAVNDAAGPAITAFCARHGVPLVTTYKGKGLIDEDDPSAIGAAGLSPRADAILLPLIARADCLVLIGYDPIEMRAGWRHPWGAGRAVIEIAPVLRTHGTHWVSHRLHGSVTATLEQLDAGTTVVPRWPEREPAAARAGLRAAFAPAAGFGPAQVFASLREVLPPETVATADSGAHRILLSQVWTCPGPRLLLQSSGLCTMGCAVPLAAGHALADPSHPAVAFVGDAGLEMGLGELATLRDLALPVIVVVLVDGSLALIEMKQRAAQRRNLGVDFGETDFPAVARAMGGEGAWVEDTATLRAEAERALGRTRFTLLACRIGRRAYNGTF